MRVVPLFTGLLSGAMLAQPAFALHNKQLAPGVTAAPTLVGRDSLVCQIDSNVLAVLTQQSYSTSALSFCSSFIHVPVVTSTTSTYTPLT